MAPKMKRHLEKARTTMYIHEKSILVFGHLIFFKTEPDKDQLDAIQNIIDDAVVYGMKKERQEIKAAYKMFMNKMG